MTTALKMTPQLVAWLAANAALAAGASDDAAKAAVGLAFATGALDAAKYAELTNDPDADQYDDLSRRIDSVLEIAQKQANTVTAVAERRSALPELGAVGGDCDSLKGGLTGVRVIGAHERYESNKREKFFPADNARGLRHRLAGQRFREGEGANERVIDEPSQLDKAVCGAWAKLQMAGLKGSPVRLTDHDRDLINYGLSNYAFGGVIGSKGTGDGETSGATEVKNRKLSFPEQKALLEDSTSGGLEAAPIVFDDMIITTPLLFGEFYPNVNVVPITRGRRIEGVAFGVPTIQSGGADNDNIDLFTTTAFVTAFDTTIFVADAAIEIGLDFLSDSPVDVTGVVVDGYSRQLLAWLDDQICNGDGTTEPEGILVSSGTTSVAGGSAAPTVGVYESFFFGISKKYKQGYSADRLQFGANETTYQRARAIAVGASDARRIFGMTHGDYMLMGHKYGINENIANTKAFFANMARYRMYRRLGMTIRATTEGQTLVRKNLMMISCRSRWGGHMELAASAAVSTTMQA